jgi:RIO kinase 1
MFSKNPEEILPEVNWDKLSRTGKDLKTEDEVFDRATLHSLWKLMTDGSLDILDFPLSTGKEGNVFRGLANNNMVAVKIYRVTNATFKHILKYLPPSIHARTKNHRQLIYQWAQKEYGNLEKLWNLGIRVPEPYAHHNNVVIMEYIGTKTRPAALLQQVTPRDPEKVYRKILRDYRTIYQKGKLVHADLSEYNILMDKGRPRIIDVGQTVPRTHPLAEEFFQRDTRALAHYFKRYVPTTAEEIHQFIRGE